MPAKNSLVIDIVSNASQFVKGFDDAIRQIENAAKKAHILDSFQSEIDSLKSELGSITSQLANGINPKINAQGMEDIIRRMNELEAKVFKITNDLSNVKLDIDNKIGNGLENYIDKLKNSIQELKGEAKGISSVFKEAFKITGGADNLNNISEKTEEVINNIKKQRETLKGLENGKQQLEFGDDDDIKYNNKNAEQLLENFNSLSKRYKELQNNIANNKNKDASIFSLGKISKEISVLQDVMDFKDVKISSKEIFDNSELISNIKQARAIIESNITQIQNSIQNVMKKNNISEDMVANFSSRKKEIAQGAEVSDFKIKDGSILVPLKISDEGLKKQVQSVVNGIQDSIQPITVPIKLVSGYKTATKDEIKNAINLPEEGVSDKTKENVQRQFDKELVIDIKTNIKETEKEIESGIKNIQKIVEGNKLDLFPGIEAEAKKIKEIKEAFEEVFGLKEVTDSIKNLFDEKSFSSMTDGMNSAISKIDYSVITTGIENAINAVSFSGLEGKLGQVFGQLPSSLVQQIGQGVVKAGASGLGLKDVLIGWSEGDSLARKYRGVVDPTDSKAKLFLSGMYEKNWGELQKKYGIPDSKTVRRLHEAGLDAYGPLERRLMFNTETGKFSNPFIYDRHGSIQNNYRPTDWNKKYDFDLHSHPAKYLYGGKSKGSDLTFSGATGDLGVAVNNFTQGVKKIGVLSDGMIRELDFSSLSLGEVIKIRDDYQKFLDKDLHKQSFYEKGTFDYGKRSEYSKKGLQDIIIKNAKNITKDNIDSVFKEYAVEDIEKYHPNVALASITDNIKTDNLPTAINQIENLMSAMEKLSNALSGKFEVNIETGKFEELLNILKEISSVLKTMSFGDIGKDISNMVDMFQRYTGLATKGEIIDKAKDLQQIYSGLSLNKDGTIDSRKTKDLKKLFDAYNEYQKMGGKKSIDAILLDNLPTDSLASAGSSNKNDKIREKNRKKLLDSYKRYSQNQSQNQSQNNNGGNQNNGNNNQNRNNNNNNKKDSKRHRFREASEPIVEVSKNLLKGFLPTKTDIAAINQAFKDNRLHLEMGYNQNRFQYTAGDSKLQKQFQDSVNGTFKQSWMYDLENQYIGMSEKTQGKTNEYLSQMKELHNILLEIDGLNIDIFDDKDLAIATSYNQRFQGMAEYLSSDWFKSADQSLPKLQKKIADWRSRNGAAMQDSELRQQYEDLKENASLATNVSEVKLLTNELNNLDKKTKDMGKGGKSFAESWQQRINSLKSYIASYVSLYDVWNVFKQGVDQVTQLDTALTEMRKVSDMSVSSLTNYQAQTFDLAHSIGTTGLQLQNSTADWMRLGESMNEASKSAQVSSVLLNVSEFDSIDQATTSLVSMSQAYKDVEKMDIVDKLNNIGNNYSISTDQIATALQNSAASLVTAHNDIDESIALITAGNAITQDASKTGAGLRTIALRIQGTEEAKEELASLGEDTDDFVVATKSKIDQQVKDFTAVASNGFKGISVLDENGNYRSTYQILQDIADVYDEIKETDKQYGTNHEQGLLELLAGKTRSNIAASILQNGDMLRSVYESSQNSQGSALEENEKYLDSVEGKIDQAKNKLQELASTTIDSNMLKGLIDGATSLLDVLNKILGVVQGSGAGLSTLFGGLLGVGLAKNGRGIGQSNFFNTFSDIKDFFTKRNYSLNAAEKMFFGGFNDESTDWRSNNPYLLHQMNGVLGKISQRDDKKGQALLDFIDSKGGVEGITSAYQKPSEFKEDFKQYMVDNANGTTAFSNALLRLKDIGKTVFSSLLTGVASMAVMWGASKIIEGIDNYIHREENAIKAGEEAQQNINESVSSYDKLNSSLQTLGQTYSDNDTKISSSSDAISSLTEKYTELKEGVNSVTNENISLSDDDYQAYLDISNQLAQAMPSLQSGTDSAGNAILNLGNNASEAKNKLQELYNVQQQITHGEISKNLQDVYEGMVTKVTGEKNGIDKQISDLKKRNQDILRNQSITDTKLKDTKGVQTNLNFGQKNNKQLVGRLKDIIGNAYKEVDSNDVFGLGAMAAKSNSLFYDGTYNQIKVDTDKLLKYLNNNKKVFNKAQNQMNAEIAKFVEKNNAELSNNNNQISALTTQREAQWKEIVPTVQSFLKTESNFSKFDKTLQEGVLNNLGNMSVDSIMNKAQESYGGDLEFYLYGEFITPLQNIGKEQQETLANLLNLDASKLNYNQYKASVTNALQKVFPDRADLQKEWQSKLGIDSVFDGYQSQIDKLSKKVSGEAKLHLGELSQEELNLAVQMTLEDGPFEGTLEGLKAKIASFKQEVQEPVPVTIQEYIQQEDSGFQKIQKATESANAGATYDSFVQNLKTAKELVESGDIGTDDFKAIAEMFSPAGLSDYTSWEKNLPNIEKYFTEGTEGVTNFMEKLEELNYAKFGDDGSFSFMTDKVHDLETIADEMGLSYESFLSLWGKLEDKGVNVDFFATAEEGKEKLVTLNGEILQAQMELNEAEIKYGKNSQAYKSKEEALESLRQRYENLDEAVKNYNESDAEKKKKAQQDKIDKANKELIEESIDNYNKGDKYNESFDPEKYRTDEDYKKRMDAYRDQLIKAGKEYGFDKMGQTITGTMSKDVEKSNKEQLGVLFKDIQDGVTRSQTGTWLNALNDYAKNQGKTLEGFLKENGYGAEEYASLKDYINSNGFLLEGVTDPITNAVTNATDLFTAGVQSAAQEFRNALLGKDSSLSDKDTEEKKKQLQKEKQDKENKKPHNVETDKTKEDKKKKVFKEVQESGGMPKLPGSLITKTGRWNKQSEGTSTDLSGLLKNGIFGKGFNPKELKTSAKDGLGWLLGSNQKDSEKTKKLPESVNSLTQEYSEQLTNFKALAKKIGIDYGETKFGNIDTNNRQVLNWNKDTLAKNETALSSWGITGLKSGDFSTVLGMWDYFGDAKLPISFSPMLQGENGQPEVLTSDTVHSYINNLITNLKNSQGSWTTADLLLADAKGLDMNGKHIQGLISGVGDYADPISKITHLTGENGSLNSISEAIQSELSKAGISVDDFISSYGDKIPNELKKSLTQAPAQTSSDILSMLGLSNAENLKTSAKDVGKRFLDNMFGTGDNNISGEEFSSAKVPIEYDKETAEESLETVNEETSESAEPIQVSAKVGKVDPVSMQEVITSTASSMSQGISAGINIKPQTTGSVQHVTQEVDSSNLGEVNDTVQTVHQIGQPDEQMTNPAEATQNVEQEVVNPIPTVLEEATQVVNQTVNKVVGKNEDPKIKDTEAKAVITGDASKAVAAAQKAEGAIKAIPKSHHTSITANAGNASSVAQGVADAIRGIPSTKNVDIHVKQTGVNPGSVASKIGKVGSYMGTAFQGGGKSFAKRVSGSAYASGTVDENNFPNTWKTPVAGTSLVGELGREIVVDTNNSRWYTVGDNGAEFRKIPKNAIIFNNDQTEELLSNGSLSGDSNARGTAFGGGSSSGKTLLRKSGSSSSSSSSSSKKSKSKSSGKSSSSNKSSNKSKSKDSKSDSNASKLSKYLENIFDWAELRLKNLATITDRYTKLADNSQVWSKEVTKATKKIEGVNVQFTKGGAAQLYNKAIEAINKQLAGSQKALNGYQNFYKTVVQKSGLDKATIKKIQSLTANGKFNIEAFKAPKSSSKKGSSSKNEKLQNIENVSKWYQKVLDTQSSIEDLMAQRAELAQKKLDAIEDIYGAKLSVYENTMKRDQAKMEYILNTSGTTSKYFNAGKSVVKSGKQTIDASKEEYKIFERQFNKQVKNGTLKKGTKAYNINLAKLRELESKIYEASLDLQEQIAKTFENIADHFEELRDRNDEKLEVNEGNIDIAKRNQASYTSNQLRNLYNERNNLQYNNMQLAAQELAAQRANKNALISSNPKDVTAIKAADKAIEEANNKYAQAVTDYKQYLYEHREELVENIENYYDSLEDYFSSIQDAVDTQIDLKKTKGKVVTVGDYNSSVRAAEEAAKITQQRFEAVYNEFKDQIEKGYLTIGSEKYYQALAKVNSLQNDMVKAEQSRLEVYNQISQLKIDNIQNVIDGFENLNDTLSNFADLLNDMGNKKYTLGKVDESYLRTQMGISEQTIYGYDAQKTEILKQMEGVEKYSDRWNELNGKLQDANSNIIKAAQSMEEFADAIREVRWDKFNKGIEAIDYTKTELSDLVDILNEDNFIAKNGAFTAEGLSAIALQGQAIKQNVEEVEAHRVALGKLREEFDNNIISEDEFTEQSREHMDAIRDGVSAYQDIRDAMVELYFDALEKENELIQENIDKRRDALDKQKQYYDYQKTIKNDTKDIKYLQSQISALEGVKLFASFYLIAGTPLEPVKPQRNDEICISVMV